MEFIGYILVKSPAEREYQAKEAEFMARTDSLCDCSKCPTRDLCRWLDENAIR